MLSAAGLVGGLGNFAFQGIIGRQLELSEFGYVNSTLGFIGLLGLPLSIASTSVVHYIAHFRANNDGARLQGLLSGCQKFLFKLTWGGSLLAMVLVKPLSDFFHFPRTSLMLTGLLCLLVGLWGGYAGAFCQGMAWFKRLAFIGLLTVGLRFLFGWWVTLKFPVAEAGVCATAFSLLANLALLFWWKDLFKKGDEISPWNQEFVQYFIVAAACMGGGFCFIQGDLLVAQRYFSGEQLGAYTAAGLLARALPMTVGPLLVVLFTSRSGQRSGHAVREQMILLGLYALGLAVGAALLLLLRDPLTRLILGRANSEASALLDRFAMTMVFVGLLQALGTWALASRWLKMGLLYGALGLAYWLILLAAGKTPAHLLQLMPVAAAVAFILLFATWLVTLRDSRIHEKARSDVHNPLG